MQHGGMGIGLVRQDLVIYLPYVGLAYSYFFTARFNEAASAAGWVAAASPRFSAPRDLHTASLVVSVSPGRG